MRILLLCLFTIPFSAWAEEVAFNADIRPIFISKCTKCHGGAKADGGLNLLYREQALGIGDSGKAIIVPGNAEGSELFRRITTDDLDDRMPLAHGDHAEAPLTTEQIETIRTWINNGAEWEKHWAYNLPTVTPPELPENAPTWGNTELDQYVLAKLLTEGLTPSDEAPKRQWIRRVSLDLTGLPPSTKEVSDFILDESPQAYQKVVDRLLASPHFGERWAALWMDLARYADSQGYEKDKARTIWPYRDYLINAFNADKPYDLFIKEQLAGDLLPNPSAEHLAASAFHRNSQTNTEGGTNDEEFRVVTVIERINTTWTAMQGFTFGCIQCHAHPYEPMPHEDYYSFMAFFNSTEDYDLDNDVPRFKYANDPKERDLAAKLYLEYKQLNSDLNAPGKELMESSVDADWKLPTYTKLDTAVGKLEEKDGYLIKSGHTKNHSVYNLSSTAQSFTALRVTIAPDVEDPAKLPVDGSVLTHLKLTQVKADGTKLPVSFAYVYVDTITGSHPAQSILNNGGAGFGGYPKLNRTRQAVLVPNKPLTVTPGDTFEYVLEQKATVTGNRGCPLRKFQLHFSENPAWSTLLTAPTFQVNRKKQGEVGKKYNEIKGTEFPVMQACPPEAQRDTRLFIGGNWLNKGEQMSPSVPSILGGQPVQNRLEMAEWIASAENPLTSRVMVNRVFSELFGRGIVETLGDFGSTGLPPTNLPLLDYLAVEFQTTQKWSLKTLLREMALSATYRQNHAASPELAERDPKNYLLARGPRVRLSSEMIRDNALATAGLLSRKSLGPSVMPHQPEGIWAGGFGGGKWVTSKGEDRHRRALYTFWRRTVPYPSFITFDTPSREVCSAQRITTNTPLHALITLNDPVYYEASAALAKKMQEHSPDLGTQIFHGYYLATTQHPSESTITHLLTLHRELTQETSDQNEIMTLVANTILNLDAALTK